MKEEKKSNSNSVIELHRCRVYLILKYDTFIYLQAHDNKSCSKLYKLICKYFLSKNKSVFIRLSYNFILISYLFYFYSKVMKASGKHSKYLHVFPTL